MTFTVLGPPRTKSNSQRILRARGSGKPFVMPSKAAKAWEFAAVLQLQSQMRRYRGRTFHDGMRWNLAAVVYREKNHAADVNNYVKAIGDALQAAEVIPNDRYIATHDGTRLDVDRANPRVEITLTEVAGRR